MNDKTRVYNDQIPPNGGFKGSNLPPLVTDAPPRVLIAGAGLAGLFLGVLLEKAGIPYDIFERSSEIKPIGAIMSLASTVMPVLEQVDVYEDLLKISKPAGLGTFYNSKMEIISQVNPARADVYVPKDVKTDEATIFIQCCKNHEGVMLRFNDNTTIHGDILVGSDGAHSSVRQHLYKTLAKQNQLPKSDIKNMHKGYISLVGTTNALDPVKYPSLTEDDCETSFIIGGKNTPYSWSTFTIPDNKICWSVTIQLELSALEEDQFSSSDWLPQECRILMDKLRDFKTPYGTLGVLFDSTSNDRISKVYLEDMFYETWTHGRTVLIGDAAHKILPSNGQGAVNAIHDATILANCLYDIKPTSFDNIKEALMDYKKQRYDLVKDQYAQSHFSAKLLYGKNFSERVLRYMVLHWIPASMQSKQIVKDSAYRPQANFLPQIPKRGTVPYFQQKPSKRLENGKLAKEKKNTVGNTPHSAATAAAV
ncbi:hypothetical protein BG015_000275 [Linnemannia schmuckeri]|uniref:FAD-binding domain-containing protein n=1 Tax=Linnemannia schmuckeri TaxID=64567 RepID=A0A9P5S7T7_9FUNG|nr:hypothetical protein BG015_000275 [Linnemannia schmuckeri]